MLKHSRGVETWEPMLEKRKSIIVVLLNFIVEYNNS